jgi:hypothetical protein
MLHRLVCFLLFTKNLVPDYKTLQAPYITPTDKIIDYVQTLYFNEYFHKIITDKHEKVVLVTAVAYDACNKYSGKQNNATSEFFKSTMNAVETYIAKTITTSYDNFTIPYQKPPFDIVQLYQGNSIPNEVKLLSSWTFDKCMVYNYNYDKCNIEIP